MTAGYLLAIDYGTSSSMAATVDDGGDEPAVVEVEGSARVPSLVLLNPAGEIVAGAAAVHQAASVPGGVEWAPKRRLGDRAVLLGTSPVSPVDMAAATLRLLAAEAARRHGGQPPREVRISYPARWAATRVGELAKAATRAGLVDVGLIPEPVAAAVHLGSDRAAVGQLVAVYDLGGGTLDTAVLRRTDSGFEVVGAPGGIDRLGGEDVDEHLYQHMGAILAARDPDTWEHLRFAQDRAWVHANHTLRAQARAAKEALSSTTEFTAYVGAPVDAEIRVTRDELEDLIRRDVARSIDELLATIERAGTNPDALVDVYLVGGSSRIPLVAREIAARLGRVPATWGDPKAAVVLGAAIAAPDLLVTPLTTSASPISEDTATMAVPVPAFGPGTPTPGTSVDPDATGRLPAVDPPTSPVQALGLEAQGSEQGSGRSRRVLLATGVVAALCLVAGLALLGGSGDDGDGDRLAASSAPPDTTAAPPVEVEADDLERSGQPLTHAGGAETTETFVLRGPNGDELTTSVAVVNPTTEALVVQHIETIPKEWAESVDDVTFSVAPTEVIDRDPVVRWELELGPGETARLTYDVALDDTGVTEARLEALRGQRTGAQDEFRAGHPWAVAFSTLTGADLPGLTWASNPATAPLLPTPQQVGLVPPGGSSTTTSTTTLPPGVPPTSGSSTSTTGSSTSTTATTTTRPTPVVTVPGAVTNIKVTNPGGDRFGVDVDVTWSPPTSGGTPTSYSVRATTRSWPYVDGSCVAGTVVDRATVTHAAGAGLSARLRSSDTNPACSWVVWQVRASNSTGDGPWQDATGTIPAVKGSEHSYHLVRAIGGRAQHGGTVSCGVVSGLSCSTNPAEGQAIAAGTAVGILVQP